jgi:lysozyme
MNIKNKLLVYGLSSALATSGMFIAKHEGLVLGTYPDPVGIITSCYGHTDPELKLGQKFSEDECLEQLAKDLSKHNAEMSKYIKVPLSAEEHAAYLSLTYNVGVGNFKASTLLKLLNKGQRQEACEQLTRWVFAKGKKLRGLVNRREDEKVLCLSGLKDSN